MSISIFQNILVFVVKTGMYLLWFLDFLAGLNFKKVWIKVRPSFFYIFAVTLGLFLSWAAYSNLFYKIAEGIIDENYYISNNDQGNYFPIITQNISQPDISAKSAIVVDRGKSKVLYKKNSMEKLAPASTVKLLTALVALDIYDLQEVLEASEYCTNIEGMRAFFPAGSKFFVKDLLSSMLIGSAGDSACVVASAKLNEKEFVELMNKKAKDIGMENSVFSNPIGLDSVDGQYSTVEDLYKLADVAVKNGFIGEIVKTEYFYLKSVDGLYGGGFYNTNSLLWQIPGSVGVKTGTTEGAGEVLIYEYEDGRKDLLIVVMGSKDRFYDVGALLNWTLLSYSWD